MDYHPFLQIVTATPHQPFFGPMMDPVWMGLAVMRNFVMIRAGEHPHLLLGALAYQWEQCLDDHEGAEQVRSDNRREALGDPVHEGEVMYP